MGSRWNPIGFPPHKISSYIVFLFFFQIQDCLALNLEGLALLGFRASVDSDPYGAFVNWDPNDENPCLWSGIHCVDGKVEILDLKGLSLGGTLTPELGKLSHLKSLVLCKNKFTGVIPREIGALTMLELLDLRANNLSGMIPAEIGQMLSLKRLLLCNNQFHGRIPSEVWELNTLSEIQFDPNLTFSVVKGISCLHRKFGHCIWQKSLKELKKTDSFMLPIRGKLQQYLDALPLFNFRKSPIHGCGERICEDIPTGLGEPHMVQSAEHLVTFVRRRLLQESSNLAAAPATGGAPPDLTTTVPFTQSSGAFPAIPNAKGKSQPETSPNPNTSDVNPPSSHTSPGSPGKTTEQMVEDAPSGNKWKYVVMIPGLAIFLSIAVVMFCTCRKRGVTTIGPWKTGLSGQLQKAFITGVPKLNRAELETACEDFSNIIDTLDDCTIYKGTLSSGVEIAVASSAITSFKDWSNHSEVAFRKKIDTLSRVNHKNFINLLGYCEEDEPFLRIMVFEYAPNGTLFEHLHVKEVEHLDWNARMRIIMGTAYCLQYMHHELNPPVAHPRLQSNSIYLTDDYAAKIGDISFWVDAKSKSKNSADDSSEHSELPPLIDTDANIYSFGLVLLEIICGRVPYSKEHGSLVNWANDYLNEKRGHLVDPTLKSVKNHELDIVCEVILECVQQDPRQRPTMKEVTAKLREVITISPEQATPRLSPLWWAELEILSVEAS